MYYKRIRELREDNDELQKDIAKLLNTTQQHYSKIENGLTEITADRIIKLAKHYKVSTDYLLGLSDEKQFLQHLRSVYKELHADRETGC